MKKHNFKNMVSMVFFLLTAIFVVLFILERKNTTALENNNMELKSEIERLRQKAGDETSDLNNSQKLPGLQSWDIKRFQKKGLKNPEKHIKEVLKSLNLTAW